MSNGKGPVKAVIEDKKVQRELRSAAESLRDASDRLRGKSEEAPLGAQLFVIGLVGAVLALVLSEDLRKAVLDRLFGAEEEFEYTSTTTPAPEPTAHRVAPPEPRLRLVSDRRQPLAVGSRRVSMA